MQNFSDKIVMEGLTFDDVLLIPARSEIIPRDVTWQPILHETLL